MESVFFLFPAIYLSRLQFFQSGKPISQTGGVLLSRDNQGNKFSAFSNIRGDNFTGGEHKLTFRGKSEGFTYSDKGKGLKLGPLLYQVCNDDCPGLYKGNLSLIFFLPENNFIFNFSDHKFNLSPLFLGSLGCVKN